jgi:hypothetical protein
MNPEYVKMFQSLQNDKGYIAVRNKIIKENFDAIKKEILNDFNRHPITIEIEAGIDAPNSSGTLNGITNLYSFIGFDAGTDPIGPIRSLLERSNYRMINASAIAESTVFFDIPTAADIFAITPMPWASGRSWAKGIESGISGLGYYLKKQKNSRSGLGVQSQKQVRSGARFKNTQYISDLINRFTNKLKDLEKLNT